MNITEVVLIVIGLTQWIKTKANLQGVAAEYLSLGVGFLLGGLYQFVTEKPATSEQWFSVLLVGLGMALVPNGLYKFTGTVAEKFGLASLKKQIEDSVTTLK